MDENRISIKQIAVLVFCGLLSPLIRMVPGETGYDAGAGGWLSPLIALPVYLLVLWGLTATFRRLPRSSGLAELYRLAFGKWLGGLATALTGLWMLVIAAVGLRFYAESFVSSIYTDTDIWLFLVALVAVVWWVCARGMETVCRKGQIFLAVLGITVGLMLVLGIREIHVYHIWPVWMEGWRGLVASAGPMLVVLGYSIPVLFRRGELSDVQDGYRVVSVWITVLCAAMSALGAVIIGMFGWQTAVRLQMPFFSMAKEVTMLNLVERVESVVAAVWVFSVVALTAALLLSAGDYLQASAKKLSRTVLLGLAGVGVVLLAAFIQPNAFQLRNLWAGTLKYWDAAACYGLPLAACGTAWLRKKI